MEQTLFSFEWWISLLIGTVIVGFTMNVLANWVTPRIDAVRKRSHKKKRQQDEALDKAFERIVEAYMEDTLAQVHLRLHYYFQSRLVYFLMSVACIFVFISSILIRSGDLEIALLAAILSIFLAFFGTRMYSLYRITKQISDAVDERIVEVDEGHVLRTLKAYREMANKRAPVWQFWRRV
jgi:TRAP-type C4-dicarboxylate transport system permease large subunit